MSEDKVKWNGKKKNSVVYYYCYGYWLCLDWCTIYRLLPSTWTTPGFSSFQIQPLKRSSLRSTTPILNCRSCTSWSLRKTKPWRRFRSTPQRSTSWLWPQRKITPPNPGYLNLNHSGKILHRHGSQFHKTLGLILSWVRTSNSSLLRINLKGFNRVYGFVLLRQIKQ